MAANSGAEGHYIVRDRQLCTPDGGYVSLEVLDQDKQYENLHIEAPDEVGAIQKWLIEQGNLQQEQPDGLMGPNTNKALTESIATIQQRLGFSEDQITGEWSQETHEAMQRALDETGTQLDETQRAAIDALNTLDSIQAPGRDKDTVLDVLHDPNKVEIKVEHLPDKPCIVPDGGLQSFDLGRDAQTPMPGEVELPHIVDTMPANPVPGSPEAESYMPEIIVPEGGGRLDGAHVAPPNSAAKPDAPEAEDDGRMTPSERRSARHGRAREERNQAAREGREAPDPDTDEPDAAEQAPPVYTVVPDTVRPADPPTDPAHPGGPLAVDPESVKVETPGGPWGPVQFPELDIGMPEGWRAAESSEPEIPEIEPGGMFEGMGIDAAPMPQVDGFDIADASSIELSALDGGDSNPGSVRFAPTTESTGIGGAGVNAFNVNEAPALAADFAGAATGGESPVPMRRPDPAGPGNAPARRPPNPITESAGTVDVQEGLDQRSQNLIDRMNSAARAASLTPDDNLTGTHDSRVPDQGEVRAAQNALGMDADGFWTEADDRGNGIDSVKDMSNSERQGFEWLRNRPDIVAKLEESMENDPSGRSAFKTMMDEIVKDPSIEPQTAATAEADNAEPAVDAAPVAPSAGADAADPAAAERAARMAAVASQPMP